ncbi:MAG: hypothetical protein EOP85_15245 [Verrucomicrobiaceae bacterium]|nr:MAG: hypothetical protein EOP85_15245 [Verrucomicrobiaceae bacterium]
MIDTDPDPYKPPAAEDAQVLPSPQRPRRVLLVGALFCLVGGAVICQILWDLFHHRLSFDLTVLMLPVGVGLLRGRTSSKWWATLWCIYGYGMSLIFVMLDLLEPGRVTLKVFGHEVEGGYPRPLFLTLAILMAAGFMTMHYLLASRKSAEYFREQRLRDLREGSRIRRVRRGSVRARLEDWKRRG